jgi:peptide/nickel transport system permease protein
MIKTQKTIVQKPLNPFQTALRNFKKNRWAVLCSKVLIGLYLAAIFADFFSPYSYDNEDRNFSYAPPSRIHFFDRGFKPVMPYVDGVTLTFDQFRKRIYEVNRDEKYRLRFLVPGDEYRLLGFFSCRYHLFGVDSPGRIYLFGADNRGRDLFSRILYGARISLSIGLIGVLISFAIGLLVGGLAKRRW